MDTGQNSWLLISTGEVPGYRGATSKVRLTTENTEHHGVCTEQKATAAHPAVPGRETAPNRKNGYPWVLRVLRGKALLARPGPDRHRQVPAAISLDS
jgi:hypothetical protein